MADTHCTRGECAPAISLPSAVNLPVIQHPRRGRLPKGVASLSNEWLRRGVDRLKNAESKNHAQLRIQALRGWFMDQAIDPLGHIGALTVAITADLDIHTKSLGIEPEIGQIFVDALRDVADRIQSQIACDDAAAAGLPSNVVLLRPAS